MRGPARWFTVRHVCPRENEPATHGVWLDQAGIRGIPSARDAAASKPRDSAIRISNAAAIALQLGRNLLNIKE